MKMPPEFRGHRFFNFRRISCNHFAFIRSFAVLLVNFADLLVSSVSESISYMGFILFISPLQMTTTLLLLKQVWQIS